LTEEPGEWRKACNRQRGRQHRHVRPANLFAQSAHAEHVLLAAHGVNHATSRKEEQRLEERVGHQMKDARGKCAHAAREKHVAQLTDSGVRQNFFDIKKVLAYSTVSQLGYMFLACGVGAFSAGIFHLMTHAFFKALLFLAAGSVIHATGGEQDMLRMGGLSKKIRWTYVTMLTATLAIAGFPPFAGFFSKDSILLSAFQNEYGGRNVGYVLYGFGLVTALLTALYMFRLIFLTFHGKQRYDEHHVHVHESPNNMLAPLMILALLSIVGGWLAAPAFLPGGTDYFAKFLQPVFSPIYRSAEFRVLEPLSVSAEAE